MERRDAEISLVRKQKADTPILFFTGGSSCAFSIDPSIIEKTCGINTFNLGLPISAGPKFLLHQALERCRAGDTLVICLEPDMLTMESEYPPSTFTLGLAIMDSDPSGAIGGESFKAQLSARDYLTHLRPGPGFIATKIAKTAVGKGYRYQNHDLRYRGRIETPVKIVTLPRAGTKSNFTLSDSGRSLLTTFKRSASQKGVRIIYSMPWVLTAGASARQNQTANRKILESIQTFIPVIDDGYQGVATDPALFSDSGQHLNAAGASVRTNALVGELRKALELP
jgi:hypothetical protein